MRCLLEAVLRQIAHVYGTYLLDTQEVREFDFDVTMCELSVTEQLAFGVFQPYFASAVNRLIQSGEYPIVTQKGVATWESVNNFKTFLAEYREYGHCLAVEGAILSWGVEAAHHRTDYADNYDTLWALVQSEYIQGVTKYVVDYSRRTNTTGAIHWLLQYMRKRGLCIEAYWTK